MEPVTFATLRAFLTRLISLAEAEHKDWSLSPSRYVDTGEAQQHRDAQGIMDDPATPKAEAAAKGLGYQPYA